MDKDIKEIKEKDFKASFVENPVEDDEVFTTEV